LITGGSAGIGFALAQSFAKQGNHVIITGRDEKRLQGALAKLTNTTGIVSDVSKQEDVEKLVKKLGAEFPKLNVVINNAGRALMHDLSNGSTSFVSAADEIHTNYLSVIRLNELLLPLLKKQSEAAIVNVTSIVAFVPNHILSTYGASKAALHSYRQSLRIALAKNTNVKVFELMPPLVNTDFSQEIGGANGIPPQEVADDLLKAFNTDTYEIHVGRTAQLYQLFLSSPAEALKAMNA
jgi:uncharacterized oxidoreductase